MISMSTPIAFTLESVVDAKMAETSDPTPEQGIGSSSDQEVDRRVSHPQRAWCNRTNMWTGCDVLPGSVIVIRDNKQHRKFTASLLKTMQVGYTGHAGSRITT
jgi:hypothetical protein